MRLSAFRSIFSLRLTAGILLALGSLSLVHAQKNKSAPASKPSAPAKSSGGGATHSSSSASSTHSGSTSGGTHTGATTGSSSGHTGPSTSNPSGHSSPTTGNPDGHTTTTTAGTHPVGAGGSSGINRTATGRPAPLNSHTVATKDGAVTRRADGKIADVHDAKRGMDVHHGLDGSRRVSVERADHSRIVAERGRPGYIERRYSFHGHDYGRRAYYWHGHEYNRFYRGYYYHGVYMSVYAPAFYYGPGFYGWAYNPWYAPVAYSWGWGGNPWYGHYGYYFAPSPVYATPSDWLTDYAISSNLAAGYAAQQEAHTDAMDASNTGGQPLITPEIKQQIASEVRGQIALENSEAQLNAQGQEPDPASSSINRMFSDGKPHVFIANSALDAVDVGGNECALSDGDVLRLSAPPAEGATEANVSVVASKGGKECRQAANVTVTVADLQEMQNGIRETVDQGMQELQAKQGKGGLPAAPGSAMAAPVQSAFAKSAPPSEVNGATEVSAQLTAANQVDLEAGQASPFDKADSSATTQSTGTINIAIGQSVGQVTAALGQPVAVVDLGTKKIYKYKDMKVTFKAGKVSDVE